MSAILFRVPGHLLEAYQRGDLRVVGSVLQWTRDTAGGDAGQIAGHFVQGTGATQGFVSGLAKAGSFAAGGPVSAITNVASVIQNEQIKGRLDAMASMLGTMQTLQVAALASSIVGIGVTVASTAIIIKGINSVREELGRKIDALPLRLREIDLEKTLVTVGTQLERFADASHRNNPHPIVENAESVLHEGFSQLHHGTMKLVLEAKIDPGMLRALIEGLSLCSSAQIKSLIWLDEKEAARRRAITVWKSFEELALQMPRDQLEESFDGDTEAAQSISEAASAIRQRAACLPALTETMIAEDINGRAYLEEAEGEDEEPLLVLPVTSRKTT